MCTYLAKRGSIYYFRRAIPAELRPAFGGRAEFMLSLRTKDRSEAKLRIPAHTAETDRLLANAVLSVVKPSEIQPSRPMSSAQAERSRKQWDFDQQQADHIAYELFSADMETERLGPVMDALAGGTETEASSTDLAKAARLQIIHEREKAGADIAALHARYAGNARSSKNENQAVECEVAAEPGKGIFLDTDIVDGWAAERKPSPRGKDAYWRDAKLFFLARVLPGSLAICPPLPSTT